MAGGTDFIGVLLPDPDAAARMVGLATLLLREPGTLAAWADSDDPLESAMAGGLLTYAQAHFGAYAKPALPHPDLGWLAKAVPNRLPPGPVVVLGCATGGEAWALRKHPALQDREIWMVDANLAALAWAQMLFDNGSVVLPFRPSATRIDYRPVELPDAAPAVRWLCADALFPPFRAGSVAVVITVNLLDSVADPFSLAQQVEALLQVDGIWVMAAPWNWQPKVTPRRKQLERHVDGEIADSLAKMLTGLVLPSFGKELRLDAELPDAVMRLTVHPRYVAEYVLQVLRLRKA